MLCWMVLVSLPQLNEEFNHKLLILMALPVFLALFPFLRNLNKQAVVYSLLFIQLLMLWPAYASLINYFLHFDIFNVMVLESKPIPVISRVYHIEFNVLLSVLAAIGWAC